MSEKLKAVQMLIAKSEILIGSMNVLRPESSPELEAVKAELRAVVRAELKAVVRAELEAVKRDQSQKSAAALVAPLPPFPPNWQLSSAIGRLFGPSSEKPPRKMEDWKSRRDIDSERDLDIFRSAFESKR